jgi:hypothetical protein
MLRAASHGIEASTQQAHYINGHSVVAARFGAAMANSNGKATAALPSSLMKSRRFIRSPRRQARATYPECRDRALQVQ